MHASSLGQTGLPDPAPGTDRLRSESGPAVPAATSFERRSPLSVGVRIGAGFGVALLLLAVLSMVVNSRLEAGRLERQWVQHSLEVLSANERAVRMIRQAEAAARGFRLIGAPTFNEQFDAAVIDAERALSDLRTLTADNPTQQQLVGTLLPVVRQRFDSLRMLFDRQRTDVEPVVLAGTAIMEPHRQARWRHRARRQAIAQ